METLDEFNRRRRIAHSCNHYSDEPVRNGIACPKCGKEMYDTNPMQMLASIPPQKNVHCDCGYSGYRIE